MKKLFKSIIACTLATACCGAFVAAGCGGGDDTKSYTITFNYNYTGSTSTTQTVDEGSTVTKPSDPTRDGYTFDDWYTTSACTSGTEVDFTAKIYANATYYAGWTEVVTETTYTVTFVISSTSSETRTVIEGDTVTAPDDPTNGNYIFSGWYADEACTTSYDFSAAITADTTIYAGWTEVGDDEVAVIYMWNYDDMGVYKVVTVDSGSKLTSLESPTRSGYLLKGWYTDEDCTQSYSVGDRVNENITLYACWYYGYTFEAEYTDLYDKYGDPRNFYGYSNNLAGEAAVLTDSDASNGYYIAGMYATGSYLYFDIESDAAVSDATLYLRLAFEYGYSTSTNTCHDGDSIGTVTVSSSQYTVSVNDEALTYSTLTFDVSSLSDTEHTSFKDFYIGSISLVAGTNTIRLEVNNTLSGEGGTQKAKAPLVDCIKIYSGATLTWDPVTDNVG